MKINRRKFIQQTAITSIGFIALSRCSIKSTTTDQIRVVDHLIKDPNGYMDLPEGFSYQVISSSGQKMSDALLVPGRPDGMGSFINQAGQTVIIRNHENSPLPLENSPFGRKGELLTDPIKKRLYDAGSGSNLGLGGTTSFVFDEDKQAITHQYMSLAGTYRNCSGGITPWNSWLTCEEDVTTQNGTDVEKDHGYVFDVPVDSKEGLNEPVPLKGLGRFNHEAVAIDPETSHVYMTEDRGDGLIYRFVPDEYGNLKDGGQLQVLAIKDHQRLDTRNWKDQNILLNQPLTVEWINIDNVTAPEDDLRYRGYEKGAARFARGEGMWFTENQIFFACTNGGPKRYGQIFKYSIDKNELELFAESHDKTVLHMCDNLTIAPWGDVLVCEDNGSLNRMHFINAQGDLQLFAINRSSNSELTGAVFSPSGKTLFVNVQENGDTVAITGPWEKLHQT